MSFLIKFILFFAGKLIAELLSGSARINPNRGRLPLIGVQTSNLFNLYSLVVLGGHLVISFFSRSYPFIEPNLVLKFISTRDRSLVRRAKVRTSKRVMILPLAFM